MSSSSVKDRRSRLLANNADRMAKIVGKDPQDYVKQSLNSKTTENINDSIDCNSNSELLITKEDSSGSESQSGESIKMLPPVSEKVVKNPGEAEFFRSFLTLIHSLMLIVLGVFSHAAYHQSCKSECFTVLHRNVTPAECYSHLLLGKMFFYGGLVSVELPFLFLTFKSCRSIGWPVMIRVFSGFCLYYVSHVLAGVAYEILYQ